MTFDILGKQINANSDQELVEAVRMAWVPTMTIQGAMETIAKQALITRSAEIRTDSTRNFLFDLQVFDMLKTVEDPWLMFNLDGIKLKFFGPAAPRGWRHKFIWSNEQPQIASINDSGTTVIRPIILSELPESDYQYKWLRHHLSQLSTVA